MTREEAIKLMREAGFVANVSVEHWGDVPFAKLCHPTPTSASLYRMLESLINRAVTHERKACAELTMQGTNEPVQTKTLEILRKERERIAKAIRARGES